jgi:hypothetical protein
MLSQGLATAKVCRLRVIELRGEIRSVTRRILSVTTWMRRKPSAWGGWDIVEVALPASLGRAAGEIA